MLTQEEEKFIVDWEQDRDKKEAGLARFSMGLPIGLLIGLGILLNYVSGWYTRATMVANSQSMPLVLITAIVLIVIFCGVFFKRHKREMNEQRYQELKLKKELQDSSQQVQQKG